MRIDRIPPFIWPDPRISLKTETEFENSSFENILKSCSGLLGVVYGLDSSGIEWLQNLYSDNPELKIRIACELFPACPTKSDDLESLLQFQNNLNGKAQFKLLINDMRAGPSSNVIYGVDKKNSAGVMIFGSTPNFGIYPPGHGQMNAIFRPDSLLLKAWKNWFDLVWGKCYPLTPMTISIPPLVPAQGDPKAIEMWNAFVNRCGDDVPVTESPQENKVSLSEEDEIVITNRKGDKVSPTEDLKVPSISLVAEKINAILKQGNIVTINKGSRIPPLDAPIKAEWFGLESFRRAGVVTRKTQYRISIIEQSQLKELENKRKMVPKLLDIFSYSWSQGSKWIPDSAVELFESEMNRVNKDGMESLKNMLSGTIDEYFKSRMTIIFKDANEMYKEFHPNDDLPHHFFNQIIDNLKERLVKALNGNILPKVSYSPTSIQFSGQSEWASPWQQAFGFVKSLFFYPRKVVADPYFLRGIRINQQDLINKMQVYPDIMLQNILKGDMQYQTAGDQIKMIQDMEKSSLFTDEFLCEIMFNMMDGIETSIINDKIEVFANES